MESKLYCFVSKLAVATCSPLMYVIAMDDLRHTVVDTMEQRHVQDFHARTLVLTDVRLEWHM